MAFTIDLTGSVAAVTGVSSGIGHGIARAFARAGAHVAGCGLDPPDSEGVDTFRRIVESEGVEAFYSACDVSTLAGPAEFAAAALERFGRIDSVVSNAGRSAFSGVSNTSPGEWEECMALDLRSHWLLAQAARTALQESHDNPSGAADIGRPTFLVNSSNHTMYTIPGCFPYNVAKAGLHGLVQSLAIEWGPSIRAMAVAPGFIDTEGARSWFSRFDDPAHERRKTESIHPVGAIGTIDQIGATFLFLASRYADFATGASWLVDGGRSALMQDGGVNYAR